MFELLLEVPDFDWDDSLIDEEMWLLHLLCVEHSNKKETIWNWGWDKDGFEDNENICRLLSEDEHDFILEWGRKFELVTEDFEFTDCDESSIDEWIKAH